MSHALDSWSQGSRLDLNLASLICLLSSLQARISGSWDIQRSGILSRHVLAPDSHRLTRVLCTGERDLVYGSTTFTLMVGTDEFESSTLVHISNECATLTRTGGVSDNFGVQNAFHESNNISVGNAALCRGLDESNELSESSCFLLWRIADDYRSTFAKTQTFISITTYTSSMVRVMRERSIHLKKCRYLENGLARCVSYTFYWSVIFFDF